MTVRIHDTEALLPTLISRFADGDGVIWTGAGVSATRADPEVGVPGADMLKRRLARELALEDQVTNALDLETVSSRYVQRFGRPQLNDELQRLYAGEIGRPPDFYQVAAQLPPDVATFATTNYDPYLENALAHRNPW